MSTNLLSMATNTPLRLYLRHSTLEIVLVPITLAHTRHEQRCICEQEVHFLKRTLRSLGKNGPW